MKRMLIIGGVISTVIAMIAGSIYWWWFEAPHQLTADVVYGQRDGKPLLLASSRRRNRTELASS